ncbi:MAG: PKD domain-containing protein [Limisphaerales bacterium]
MKFNIFCIEQPPQAIQRFAALCVAVVCFACANAQAAPIVQTQAATSITTSSATLNSFVNPNGASTTIHFDYGLTASYGSSTISGNIGLTSGNYGTSISGLSPNTTYHFRIVGSNSGGTANGSDLTFTTSANAPTAQTQAATSITTSSATLNSFVNPNGASTTIHFDYGLTASYGSSTISGNIGTSAGNYGTSISGLSANTTYHFRIVASSIGGTANGSDLTFTTSANAPTAQTQAATSITTSSATLNSFVNPNGASTTIHFDYGLTASYGSSTISGNIGTSAGNYGTAISGLSPNTTYHFRIVASSSGGTANGSDLTFTTSASAPTVQTLAATLVTATSATLNSSVDPNGASTTIHFDYGLTASYGSSTISGNIGTSFGNYGTSISGLAPNTTYHFRIVASSSGGTANGNDLTFTTSASGPTVQTLAATLVTATSATLNSSIDPNGASTTIHFDYGLTASYGSSTISGNIGTTAGNYGTSISGLSPNTTYHFRIVASSSGGTVNGGDLTFTTSASGPTAQTLAAASISTTSAQLNGSINPNGLTTTAHFEYGTTTSYGSSTPTGNFGTTPQSIAYTVSGLAPNTTYHFRIVASNSGGTANGNDATFITAGSGAPTVQTLAATAATTTTAQFNGSINPNGFATTAYFEYGQTTTYGSTTTAGNFGTSVQSIGFVQAGLTPNTTYHYRIVAFNNQGTTRGLDATFTTLPASAPAQQAWVAGTSGLGLRLRSAPGLTSTILLVMPEGSTVTLLGDTQNADGYLWRHLTYAAQNGWADAQYLVFTPGTTPIPPAGPITLRQLQADGLSPIAGGGMANASSVVLAATPSGPSSQQFSLQFEVRPSGTAFSDPTATTTLVQGGSEARATVSALANQNYHWRSRVLDGNGVPSSWVSFSGNTTDFTVNAPTAPLALFNWSPAQVYTGDTVIFTAQAAAQSGLTFSWNFGGAQTATGSTINQTFSQSGNIIVTLTVTDSQSNQSQHSETITVLSKDLLNEINHLAQQTSQSLQQLQVNAVTAAADADYFQQRVESYRTRVGINLAFGLIGAGMPLADFKTLLRSSLPAVAVDLAVDADTLAAQAGTELLLEHNRGLLYADIFAQPITSFVAQKNSDIEQLRQQAIAAVVQLTPTQADQLTRDLRGRLAANLSISSTYDAKVRLPNTFSSMESSVGDAWSLFEVGTTAATTLLTAGSSTAATFLLAESANLAQSTLDQLTTLQQQPLDVQMLAFSLDAVGQAWLTSDRMASNAHNGLLAVINAQVPTAPQGSLTVQFIAEGSPQQFWYGQRWVTTAAYARVTVRNTGQVAATYRVDAAYPHTFTPSNLGLPFDIPGFTATLNYLLATDDIQLAPNDQIVLTDHYLSPAGGQKPDGLITYTLTASTPGSCYLEATQTGEFNTTLIDTNGTQIDHSTIPDTLLSDAPVQSSLVEFASGVCALRVVARNALDAPLLLNIQQDLPTGTIVVNADGSTIATNRLIWELTMQPDQVRSFQVVLKLPTPLANPPLTNTTSSVYDALNAVWLQFSQAPVVSQMASTPPPQLQPGGFIGGGFGLDLQALVPGIYRVEATTNFINWNPVSTITNTAGPFQVIDTDAQSYRSRFYRAASLQ